MKNVWIINHYAQSPGGPGGTRHFQIAKSLPLYGWNACILAASTELNSGRQRLRPGELHRLDVVEGISFLWLLAPLYKGNGFGRIRNMLAFAFRLLCVDLSTSLPQPDLIVGSSVHPFAVLSAYCLSRRYRVPFVFEVRDLWPQTLIDFGLLRPNGIPALLLRCLEGFLYRKSNAIVTLLPYAFRYIQRFGIRMSKIYWIPNGVDISCWQVCNDSVHSSRDHFRLMYFGAFGMANSLETLLQAMHLLSERPLSPPVSLRLIGDGPMKPSLVAMADGLKLRNVFFEEPVEKNNIPLLALEADCFVAILKDSPLYRYGISLNKLYDYMASGKPVIFAASAANNPIADAGAGITVAPGDASALADAIANMSNMHAGQRAKFGRAGLAYVKRRHDACLLAKDFASVLNSCL